MFYIEEHHVVDGRLPFPTSALHGVMCANKAGVFNSWSRSYVQPESILESVNSLLASGEVPGLYTHEELEPLLAPLKEHMGDEGFRFRTYVHCCLLWSSLP